MDTYNSYMDFTAKRYKTTNTIRHASLIITRTRHAHRMDKANANAKRGIATLARVESTIRIKRHILNAPRLAGHLFVAGYCDNYASMTNQQLCDYVTPMYDAINQINRMDDEQLRYKARIFWRTWNNGLTAHNNRIDAHY